MCLYETELINQKYQPTKKNKGNVPECKDYRQLTIKIGCGWCKECRNKIANDWRIRLFEEIKVDKNCTFITLSLSAESIEKLEKELHETKYKGYESEFTDVNILASFAVRRWCERHRKLHKKAPKHWLITELGHKGSERLHLHGLIWDCKDIDKTWKYGNIWKGTYVNNRTINYIIKYVTKLDEYHKGYRQKIFTSHKIGIAYTYNNRYNEYKDEDTKITYKTYNGYNIALPRYYKEKIWTEEQREKLWSMEMDKNKVYINGEEFDATNEDEIYIKKFNHKLDTARNYNRMTGYGSNTTTRKTYIITDIMKLKYKDIINYNKEKLVKAVDKRTIEKTIYPQTDKLQRIGKNSNITSYVYGKYINGTTEAQRNYNELIEEAKKLGISVRKLRLIKAGIIGNIPTKL